MTEDTMTKCGLFAVCDTGPPAGSDDYTTLVVVHGFAWHAGLGSSSPQTIALSSVYTGVFTRFLPLAEPHNSRIVLVNRRDYPGAVPFDQEELTLQSSTIATTSDATTNIKLYMRARARELYDFLEIFVKTADIPPKSLVLAGWSFGSIWITALLAHVSTFPVNDIELDKYIRRVVAYGRSSSIVCSISLNLSFSR